jgi:hypothetical protein
VGAGDAAQSVGPIGQDGGSVAEETHRAFAGVVFESLVERLARTELHATFRVDDPEVHDACSDCWAEPGEDRPDDRSLSGACRSGHEHVMATDPDLPAVASFSHPGGECLDAKAFAAGKVGERYD